MAERIDFRTFPMAVVVDVKASSVTASQHDELNRIAGSGADVVLLRLPTGAAGSIAEAGRLAQEFKTRGISVSLQIGETEVVKVLSSSAGQQQPFEQLLIPWRDDGVGFDVLSYRSGISLALYIHASDLMRVFRERSLGDRSGGTLPSLLPEGAALVIEPANSVEVGAVLSLLQSAPLLGPKPLICMELSSLSDFEQISALAFMSNARVLAGFSIQWVAVSAFELASDALGFFDAIIDLTDDDLLE
ncbi:MAG: hypothetical protein HKL82_02010 [Acidimicrobiaceae bacterium]|nr:hypothetical protein [Acidimicrobiaceae bacterium]